MPLRGPGIVDLRPFFMPDPAMDMPRAFNAQGHVIRMFSQKGLADTAEVAEVSRYVKSGEGSE